MYSFLYSIYYKFIFGIKKEQFLLTALSSVLHTESNISIDYCLLTFYDIYLV